MRKLVHRRITRALFNSVLVLCLAACTAAFGQSKQISAVARGTSTQMGRIVNIDIRINSLSTAADQGILLEAFQASGSEGVANALDKMRSK